MQAARKAVLKAAKPIETHVQATQTTGGEARPRPTGGSDVRHLLHTLSGCPASLADDPGTPSSEGHERGYQREAAGLVPGTPAVVTKECGSATKRPRRPHGSSKTGAGFDTDEDCDPLSTTDAQWGNGCEIAFEVACKRWSGPDCSRTRSWTKLVIRKCSGRTASHDRCQQPKAVPSPTGQDRETFWPRKSS